MSYVDFVILHLHHRHGHPLANRTPQWSYLDEIKSRQKITKQGETLMKRRLESMAGFLCSRDMML